MKKKELMDDIIRFLRALRDNNNRPWFMAHKDEYLRCQQQFDALTASLIEGVASFDDTVRGLQPKDCTYRIYRDVRFSADKSPYKTHMGCFICPGGKKSGYVGYYFHVAASPYPSPKGKGAQQEWVPINEKNATGHAAPPPSGGLLSPDNGGVGGGVKTIEGGGPHMLAVGDYCYEPRVLQILREDIAAGEGDFDDIVRHQCSPLFWLDQTGALKRNPKGFSPDAPYPEYLRLKTFCLCYEPDDSFITSPHLAERVVELFRTTLPFTRYINRAIDFAHHE